MKSGKEEKKSAGLYVGAALVLGENL